MDESHQEWLDANSRDLAKSYPQFEPVASISQPEAIAAWQGELRPFDGPQDLSKILDDLQNEGEVVVRAGTLVHDPICLRNHAIPDYLSRLSHIGLQYAALIVAYPPKRHPRAFITSPRISRLRFPIHPHLNGDDSVCSYLPSQGVLPWSAKTLRTLLDFTAIWLAKHTVWCDTGDGRGGIWIGPAAGHSIPELLATVPRNAECPCGSGKKYKHCHRPEHERSRWLVGSSRFYLSNLEVPKEDVLR